jgi:hypothetical protein
MAVPATLPYHNHISEQQAGPDEDCLWCAGVEFLREGYDPAIPHTHAEADALRAASGDTGFSNMTNFRVGVAKRYPKIDLNPSQTGATNIIGRFKATGHPRVGLVLGKLTNMSTHFRRWYPNFTGGHAVFVAWTGTGFWWCDPGAPENLPDGTKYLGEAISETQLRAFIGSYGMPTILHDAIQKPVAPPATATYTQAQVDAIVASTKAAAESVCIAKVATATATASVAGYNSGLAAASAAVAAVPKK